MTAPAWPGAAKGPLAAKASLGDGRGSPLRLFLVDDSLVIRTLVASWIEAEPDLELAGVAADGAQAVQMLAGVQADVCILDLEMPVMGGLEALPKLLRLRPNMKVLIASRLTLVGADASLRALEAGAAECLAKPSAKDPTGAETFRRDLLVKARTLGRAAAAAAAVAAPAGRAGRPTHAPPLRALASRIETIEILAVAASTGGPPALRQFLQGLSADLGAPVVIVQHMPAAFVDLLAVQLTKTSPFQVVVAQANMALEPGLAYLAPGDQHLRVARRGGQLVAELDQGPPENYCRPAADVLFRSVAKACGAHVLGVVLTGMGRDGWAGSEAIVRAGGLVLAQDEASSVVWGMPGAVVEAGLASVVGRVDRLAEAVRKLAKGEAP